MIRAIIRAFLQVLEYAHQGARLPEKGVETRLNCVRAPFGDCGRVFTELNGKPFVRLLLLHKHAFDSVNIFAHEMFCPDQDAKITIFTEKSVISCHYIRATARESIKFSMI